MNLDISQILLAILLAFTPITLHTQSYTKHIHPQNLHNLHLSTFSNNDILIANSSSQLFNQGQEEGLIHLQRIEPCGNIIWAFQYQYSEGFLELNDAVLDGQDNIYAYGTIFSGSEEQLFIFKSDASGLDTKIKVFDTTTIDHFSYSIDSNQDGLLIAGLLLDVAANRVGFVGRVNFDLDITSLTTFSPIAKTGKAILTQDNQIVMSSGSYIYQFDETNALLWAKEFPSTTEIIAGPFDNAEITLLAITANGRGAILSFNRAGERMGKTTIDQSVIQNGCFSGKSQDETLFNYSMLDQNRTIVNTMTIDKKAEIIKHQSLPFIDNHFTESFETAYINDRLIIAGNAQNQNEDLGDYLLQVPLSESESECHTFSTFEGSSIASDSIDLNELVVEVEDFTFATLQSIRLTAEPFSQTSTDICNDSNIPTPTIETNTIDCGESWVVGLPTDEYAWIDGFESIQRTITARGIYTARTTNCDNQESIEYHLEIEPCDCRVYLPNSFSPNGDGINDHFELGIRCDFLQMEILIYDRWGGLLFNSQMNSSWDGSLSNLIISPGIYGVQITYSWIDNDGQTQTERLTQSLTVIK